MFVSCNAADKNKSTEAITEENIITLTQGQMQEANVKTGVLSQQQISTMLKVSGVVDVPPQNLVSISLPLGGYVKHTKLLPGMHFNKGEIIAEVEDVTYIQLQQDFLETKEELNFMQPEFERQTILYNQKAISDKVYQQTVSDYNKLKIKLSSLEQKLQLIGINATALSKKAISKTIFVYAPIEGFVTKVNVNVGKYVNPTDVLFELVNPDDIHLNLNVFEKDLEHLYVGQNVNAYTSFNPDKRYPCTILLIGKDVGSDRSSSVHCHFEKYDNKLHPGMYMSAEIETIKKTVLALQKDAIVRYNNKNYVFVSEANNTFRMMEIITGISNNNYTEVTNESVETLTGKKIVVKGAYVLLMKLKNTAAEE